MKVAMQPKVLGAVDDNCGGRGEGAGWESVSLVRFEERAQGRGGLGPRTSGRLPLVHLGRRRAAHVRTALVLGGRLKRRAAKLVLHEEELLGREVRAAEVEGAAVTHEDERLEEPAGRVAVEPVRREAAVRGAEADDAVLVYEQVNIQRTLRPPESCLPSGVTRERIRCGMKSLQSNASLSAAPSP